MSVQMITEEHRAPAVGESPKPGGAGAAVTFSAAIGVFALGLATVLATASPAVKNALNWWNPAGPLAGKSGVGVLAWLVSWPIFHALWSGKEVRFQKVWILSLILLALGFVMTFPPVFEAFEPKH